MSDHKANDSGLSKSKKDKLNLKNKGVKSPDLSKMYSVKLITRDVYGCKKYRTIYKTTLAAIIKSIGNNEHEKIIEPKKK